MSAVGNCALSMPKYSRSVRFMDFARLGCAGAVPLPMGGFGVRGKLAGIRGAGIGTFEGCRKAGSRTIARRILSVRSLDFIFQMPLRSRNRPNRAGRKSGQLGLALEMFAASKISFG